MNVQYSDIDVTVFIEFIMNDNYINLIAMFLNIALLILIFFSLINKIHLKHHERHHVTDTREI